MDYNKLLILFVMTGLLISSCQSSKYPKTGHFSNIKLPARSVASQSKTDQYVNKYLSYQDPKQILIYCKLNSQKPETCYEINLSDSLNSFIKSSKENRDTPITMIKENLNFEKQNSDLVSLTNEAKNFNIKLTNDIVEKRQSFCAINAKKDINRCLNQYIKRDTFSVLNKYQNKFKLNGLEYLYLKKEIRQDLENKFSSALIEIEKKRSQHI